MKRTLLFLAFVLAAIMTKAQVELNDYIPFVKNGKEWVVINTNADSSKSLDKYRMSIAGGKEGMILAGKVYMPIFRSEHLVGYLREEERKVYLFDSNMQKEFLIFDYSLKAGDTYETYSYDEQKMVTYEVLSVGYSTTGHEVFLYGYDEKADTVTTNRRYLREWTICRTDDRSCQKTWIEGVGSLEGPLANLYDSHPVSSRSYLLYLQCNQGDFYYIPFSYYDDFINFYGCNLPSTVVPGNPEGVCQLNYEMEGDRLHIYGTLITPGPVNYAIFAEKPTDDPLVHKLNFSTQQVMMGVDRDIDRALFIETDFYLPGLDPNLNYIVEDRWGVHPVINKATQSDYRPLVVEGKHWTYDNFMPMRPAEYDHYYYYYLKGDTLISGKKCLKMYSENRANDGIVRYEGALYEESKKVYCFFPGKDEAELLYDFDCKVGDTLQIYYPYNYQVLVKDIQTEDNGGIDVKKYTLKIIWDYEEEYVVWIEGVGAMLDFFGMVPAAGNYNSLNACELNGEKLYQYIEPDLTAKGYHKMGIEGKRWNYIHYYVDEDGEHRDPYSYVVKGDTVIRRTTYKKLWYQDEKTERLVCLLRETRRTVYKNTDMGNNSYDSPIMTAFFVFDRDDFGRVFTWKAKNALGNTNWMVYGVDTIEVKGQPFRRYTCLQKYSEEGEELSTIEYNGEGVWHDIWVEGVGSASHGIEDQIPSHEPPVKTTSDYTYFVSCYEDGECIFTADDFNVQNKPAPDMAYRPFIEEGKVWKVGSTTGISDSIVKMVEYYYFDGDTIIDGKTFKQMMCQRYVNHNHPDYAVIVKYPLLRKVGAWYEEDKKVYFYNATSKQFRMMYDFSLNANDTLLIDNYYPYVIGPKQTGGLEGFKGIYRDVMWCTDRDPFYCTTWLEGVGGIDGPTINIYYGKEGRGLFLMSCTVGDEVIYFNGEYEDGATPEEVVGARKDRIDFTHTIKIKPKSRTARVAEQSLYGEYNSQQLGLNLNALDEAYQVSITDEAGKVVYEKAVNAGSIVGLNIDISAYIKGRYTVTVENSNELFTGQFETQTTGISDAESLNDNGEMKNDIIYNLQGQRVNSLQKGLNIVNGRKVYVK